MIIYIPLEIAVRELQGHLLFATVAAGCGHQVVITSPNDIWLFKRLGLLPKGAYLLKNTNVPSASATMYKTFLQYGFDLYCQEQEPSILWDNFDKFLFDYNITRDQVLPFKAVFCWGERDKLGYRDFFESKRDLFVNSGSPRADLWSPRFSSLRRKDLLSGKPYMLVVSNFGFWLGARHWSEWLAAGKQNETTQSLYQEDSLLNFMLEDSAITLHMVKAVRHLAARCPDYRIVVRPHPLDHPPHWKCAVGDHPNIEVIDNTSPLSAWIEGASLVIQNGCTSAIEAVLMKVPLISLGPERHQGDLKIPSRLGLKAETLDVLDKVIQTCLDSHAYEPIQAASEAVLKPLLSTEGGNAALRMTQEMEQRSAFNPADRMSKRNVLALRVVRHLKNGIDGIRSALKLIDAPKGYKALDRERIRHDVEEMARIFSLPVPELTFITKSGLLINPFSQQ